MRLRFVISAVFSVVAGLGAADADSWSGTNYDIGAGEVARICMLYCSDSTPAPSGSALDLNNAYIAIAGMMPTSSSPTGSALATGVGLVSLNRFASANSVANLQSLLGAQGGSLASLQALVGSQGKSLVSLQDTVGNQGQAILNLQGQNTALNAQMAAVTKDLAIISNQVASLVVAQRETEKHAWIGSALASALVAVAPAEGKTNRLGINMATVQGQSAMGLNYAHVSGGWDVNAGVAISTSQSRYAEGRVGVGFSW